MANIRPKDLPTVTSVTAGDKLVIDGATARSITVEDLAATGAFTTKTQQIITSGATVTVAATDGLIAINKTVGSATAVNLPLSSAKVGDVKVSDFKADSGTNFITVNVTGSDKLPGNLTAWVIASNGASVVFTPLEDGSGYAV